MKKRVFFPVVVGVIERDGKFLLTRRRDGGRHDGVWQFPGGGLEFGESVEECLFREVKEETGLEVEIVRLIPKILHRVVGKYHLLLIYFLCKVKGNSKVVLNDEADKYGWFSPSEIKKLYRFPDVDVVLSHLTSNI